MVRGVLTVFTIILVCTGAAAQGSKKWTLKECVDIALENNLMIKRSRYTVKSFQANMIQSKAAFLPTINASTSFVNNYGRALNPVSNSFVDRNSTAISPSLNASWTIFNGLRIQNSFKQSQRDLLASNHDLEKAKNDVILNVVTLYTNVIFNLELFENAKYQLNSSQQQLDRIGKQVTAGSLALSNQLTQEAQVATNEVSAINQENVLNLSILQLKQAMQIPASEMMEIEIPDLQLEDLVLDEDANGVYRIAVASMPEVKSALLKVESADHAIKSSRGSYYPRISLNAGMSSNYSSLNNTPRFEQDGTFRVGTTPIAITQPSGENVFALIPNSVQTAENWNEREQLQQNLFKNLSLQFNIPVFNGLATRTNVQRSIISREIADVTVKETQNLLRQSIETAYNDAVAASRSYAASRKQVNAQEEAYRMNKQRFEVGALNNIEYQVSENDLFRAKSDLVRAKYNFIFRKKVLDFYQGKSIEY